MTKRLKGTLVTLIYEATLKSFWRRNALSRFLRQAGVAQSFVSAWAPQETKRAFLDRLFAELDKANGGQDLMLAMARDLVSQDTFPDLQGWEDSDRKLKDAREGVAALRRAISQVHEEVQSERERQQSRQRVRDIQAESTRSRESLDSLNKRMLDLASRIGAQKAGYEFQEWFYDLMTFFEIVNRRPYVSGGRQIDGSITVSGTTYLVELKFTREQSDAPDIDTIRAKINDKADNTMGVMISMSGYSSVAIAQASGPRTPLLLMDSRHIFLALSGAMPFGEIVDRVRRHGSQTGEAFLHVDAF